MSRDRQPAGGAPLAANPRLNPFPCPFNAAHTPALRHACPLASYIPTATATITATATAPSCTYQGVQARRPDHIHVPHGQHGEHPRPAGTGAAGGTGRGRRRGRAATHLEAARAGRCARTGTHCGIWNAPWHILYIEQSTPGAPCNPSRDPAGRRGFSGITVRSPQLLKAPVHKHRGPPHEVRELLRSQGPAGGGGGGRRQGHRRSGGHPLTGGVADDCTVHRT